LRQDFGTKHSYFNQIYSREFRKQSTFFSLGTEVQQNIFFKIF